MLSLSQTPYVCICVVKSPLAALVQGKKIKQQTNNGKVGSNNKNAQKENIFRTLKKVFIIFLSFLF